MRAVDIIIKKRDRGELTRDEIRFFVDGITAGTIPDYQIAAWAMAIFLNGMTPRETTELTLAMAESGEVIDLSDIGTPVVDKHSTGGVGDKTSLVVLPILAACGLAIGKMSGRGLGFSGGTLDKMESIPGYRVDLSTEEFKRQLTQIGLVLCGQSKALVPADGKLYALRDVTGTVDSIPLIASSIMSKKIAGGAQAILLDVKVGNGAFMTTLDQARQLADLMTQIGNLAGRKVKAVLADMNQPLGQAVGNALEVREAIATLHNNGPADFRQHCLHMAAHLLLLSQAVDSLAAAYARAEAALADGSAWQKFRQLVQAQSGDVSYVDDPDKLPKASLIEVVPAPRSGYLAQVHARTIGEAAVLLGAGRAQKNDPIDHAVGFIIHHKVGDPIRQGEPLFTIHASRPETLSTAIAAILQAHQIVDRPVPPLPQHYE